MSGFGYDFPRTMADYWHSRFVNEFQRVQEMASENARLLGKTVELANENAELQSRNDAQARIIMGQAERLDQVAGYDVAGLIKDAQEAAALRAELRDIKATFAAFGNMAERIKNLSV